MNDIKMNRSGADVRDERREKNIFWGDDSNEEEKEAPAKGLSAQRSIAGRSV